MSYYCRKFLIVLCILQFIATLEWQVFNFLGYMWTPIIVCFLHLIFILVGFFGALQYRPRCAVVYVIWLLLWIGVNVFIICIYLQVGVLRKDSAILNLGLGNKSWWFDHGVGCRVNASHPAYTGVRGPSSVIPSEREVTDCLLAYPYVEVVHAGVQILLSVMGIVGAVCLAHLLRNEEDTSQPVKSSEMEYINMRRSSGAKPPPLFVSGPGGDLSPTPHLNSSRRRLHDPSASPTATPPPSHEFDTLVTEVDTLSPHHSHESLPPHPLSANRLLRDSLDPDPEPSASPRRRSGRRRTDAKQRSRRGAREARGGANSDVGPGEGSLDRRSAFSRDSQSTRTREPLPWVMAAPVASSRGREEDLPPYQPPPYTSQPPSVAPSGHGGVTLPSVAPSGHGGATLPSVAPGGHWGATPPSPALYVPPQAPSRQSPRQPRTNSPYENWPVAPRPPTTPRYENAWSPVPPASRGPPSSLTPSSRGGVIFFRSSGSGEDGDQTGHSFGGSVMV